MGVIVGRPYLGITINPLEYILDDEGQVRVFLSEEEATVYLNEHGYTDSEIENEGIVFKYEDGTIC